MIEPGSDARSKISGAFGKKSFGQLGGTALEVALADLNNREKFMTFALPFRLAVLAAQAVSEETQIVGTSEKTA